MNKLSTNLRNLLLVAKISESELARRTGVPQQVINRILSGANKNPKIATLNPLATYFMITISQLIGDELCGSEIKLDTNHLGWHEVPVFKWELLGQTPFKELQLQNNEKVSVDIHLSNKAFALRMQGNSMEPKFAENTILIFEADKNPANGDFTLLFLDNGVIELRQLFVKNNKPYKKSLNPSNVDYNLTLINEDTTKYLGLLVQSRTDYITR